MRNHRDILGVALIFGCLLGFNSTARSQEEVQRKYTLAEKSIQHARESLPGQIYTEDPELTRQVHNLYIDCLFDKLWEPALPGLPYRFFSISGAGDESYAKCQLLWDPMFILNAWAPLNDNQVVHDVFRNYWNVIDNNTEAPKGSFQYGMVPCTSKPDLPQDGFSQIPILDRSIAVNTIYGIVEDYRTIVVPSHAKGRRLKLGKLEVNYPTDNSVELISSFQRESGLFFLLKKRRSLSDARERVSKPSMQALRHLKLPLPQCPGIPIFYQLSFRKLN
ncbi:MAG: hypothetical protein GY790_22145 [Bacteroidetes bacterium]|nr:hypothetical protein [Bacteroidota bacterium]